MRHKHFEDGDEIIYYFDEYLKECKKDKSHPNWAGFAVKCFCDKQTLLNYKVENHPFLGAMKYIESKLESETLNNKMSDNLKTFYLKNAFKRDYRDKQEIEQNNLNTNMDIDLSKLSYEQLQSIKKCDSYSEIMKIVKGE